MEGQLVMLRDYQVDAINTFLKNPQALQEIATGAGKTMVLSGLALITGERADAGVVRSGAERAEVDGDSVRERERHAIAAGPGS